MRCSMTSTNKENNFWKEDILPHLKAHNYFVWKFNAERKRERNSLNKK